MSLAMMALRVCAVQALKSGNTLVKGNVLDSEISAIDVTSDGKLRSDEKLPFIAVYTDAAKATDLEQSGLRSNGVVDLVFNTGISAAMTETNKETGESRIVELFPATDANLEAILDAIEVQITRTLTDPNNKWAQMFGDFIKGYVAKEHVRSSSAADSVRIAAGQTRISVEVYADHPATAPLPAGGIWARFLDLLAQDNHPQQVLFQQLISGSPETAYPDFETLIGLTSSDAAALRLYTFDGVPRSAVISQTGIG